MTVRSAWLNRPALLFARPEMGNLNGAAGRGCRSSRAHLVDTSNVGRSRRTACRVADLSEQLPDQPCEPAHAPWFRNTGYVRVEPKRGTFICTEREPEIRAGGSPTATRSGASSIRFTLTGYTARLPGLYAERCPHEHRRDNRCSTARDGHLPDRRRPYLPGPTCLATYLAAPAVKSCGAGPSGIWGGDRHAPAPLRMTQRMIGLPARYPQQTWVCPSGENMPSTRFGGTTRHAPSMRTLSSSPPGDS